MYNKNYNENLVLYDVDETLVSFNPISGVQPVIIPADPTNAILYPIQENIEKLKQSKLRGHHVTVHSAGGVVWVENVIVALSLEKYVDVIQCKPKWFCDDEPAETWMRRFYGKKEEREIL